MQTHAQPTPDSCIITSLPYVQDFGDCPANMQGVDSVFVPCWHRISSNDTGAADEIYISSRYYSLHNALVLSPTLPSIDGSSLCVVLPKLDSALVAASPLQLRLQTNAQIPQTLRIGTMSDPNDTSTFTLLSRQELPNSNIILPLDSTALHNKHIAIIRNHTCYSLVIPKITIERTPVCGTVYNVWCSANGLTGARVDWNFQSNTPNDSVTYTVRVYPYFNGSTLPPDSILVTSIVTNRQYAILRNLSPNTLYSIVVSASCNGDTTTPVQWDCQFLQTRAFSPQDTCPYPTIVRTESDTTSITLEWIPNGVGLAWELSYENYNNRVYGDLVVAETNYTDSVYTFQGLLPGNTYMLYVQPVCRYILAQIETSTVCTNLSLPYTEDFEHPNPTCWYRNRISLSTQSVQLNNHYYELPQYSEANALPQTDEPIYNLRLSGMANNGYFVAGVLTNENGVTSFIPFDTVHVTGSSTWNYFSVHYNNYTGPDGRIALWRIDTLNLNSYVDNLRVDIIPSCCEPFDIEVTNTSFSTAVARWNDLGSAMNYEIEYALHGFAHGSGTTLGVFADSVTLTGLQHSTRYDLYVRAHCSGDTSSWSYPYSFTTPCGDIDHLPYVENFDIWDPLTRPPCWTITRTRDGYAAIYPDGFGNNRLFSSDLNPATFILPRMDRNRIPVQGTRIKMTAWNYTNDFSTTGLIEIGVITDLTGMTFVPVDTIITRSTPTQFEIPFDSYTDTGEYIAFRIITDHPPLYFDDIIVDYIPNCRHPENPIATHVDSTHALISWTSIGTPSHWQIAYGHRNFNPDSNGVTIFNTTGTAYLLGGLLPGSEYDVYVRSICPDANTPTLFDTSEWTIYPLSFSTMQIPAPVPYYCDFEDTTEAYRWQSGSNISYQWSYGAVYNDSIGANDTNQHGYRLSTVADSLHIRSTTVNMVLYRDFDFGTAPASGFDSSVSIAYRTRCENPSPLTGSQFLACLVNPSQALHHYNNINISPWGPTDSLHILNQIATHNEWISDTIELDTLHGIHRMAFYLTGRIWDDVTGTPINIDDIQIFHTPCPRPFDLTIDSISDTLASLSWYGQTTARYEVSFFPTGTRDTVTVTAYTNHILLTGLEPATQYTATVRLVCGDNVLSTTSSPIIFSTLLCNGLRSDTVELCPSEYYENRSSLIPVSYYDIYSYSQQIYHASDFSGPGSIQAINLNLATSAANPTSVRNESRIYLGHTHKQQFLRTIDFIDPASLQLVYLGPMPIPDGWNKIILQSPFQYDGVSNLVLAVLNSNNSTKPLFYHICDHNDSLGIVFHGSDPIDASTYETLLQYNGNISLTNGRNQAIFDFCPANPCPQARLKRPNLRYSRVTLRWHGDTTASNYEIHYRLLSRTQWDTISTTDSSLTIDNIYPNHEYLYRVRLICDDTPIPNWAYGTFRTSPDDCAFPENLHLTELTHDQVSFAWTPDENNTTYTLRIFNTAFDTTVTSILARKSISGLLAGVTYYASVQAHCSPDNCTADWSDTICFTTPVCPNSDSLTYSDLQGNSVVLDWQCDPQVSRWEIQYGPLGFTQGNGNSVIADHHPYTLSGLIGETSYDAYVRSVCDNNWYSESWSNKTTFTTPYSAIADPGSASPLFTLSPNPATGSVSITVNSQLLTLNSQLSIVLRDATGRELYSTNISNLNSQISILNYPAGVYFVTLVTAQGTATLKLIIEN